MSSMNTSIRSKLMMILEINFMMKFWLSKKVVSTTLSTMLKKATWLKKRRSTTLSEECLPKAKMNNMTMKQKEKSS